MKTITIAWLEQNGDLEFTGRHVKGHDGVNWVPETRTVDKARACIWLNEGTAEDLRKAEAYSKTNSAQSDSPMVRVYTFPTNCEDPLGESKRKLLDEYRAFQMDA